MKHISEIIAPELIRMTLLAIGWQMDSERHFWRKYNGTAQLIEIQEDGWLFYPDCNDVSMPNTRHDLSVSQDELLELIQTKIENHDN